MEQPRKMVDCRLIPNDRNCTIAISGREDEVLEMARQHAISVHGHKDTPDLRDQLRQSLRDEPRGSSEVL